MERAVPHVPADDLEVAKAFYVGKLGFDIAFEASDDATSGILGLARGTIRLTVDCPMDGHGRNACVSLEVDDADAYFEEWRPGVEEDGASTQGRRVDRGLLPLVPPGIGLIRTNHGGRT